MGISRCTRSYFRLFSLFAALLLSLMLGGGCDCKGNDEDSRDVGIDDTQDDIDEHRDTADENGDIKDDTREDEEDTEEEQPDPIAHLFIVHNSPDPDLGVVDIYLGDELFIDDLPFRSAQTFTTIDAGTFNIAIAPEDSDDRDDALTTFSDREFEAGKRYLLVISGLQDPDNFDDNPDEAPLDLALYNFPDARQTSTDDDMAQVLVFHGSPDAGSLTLQIDQEALLVSDLSYGDFHNSYLDFAPGITAFDLLHGDPPDLHDSYQTTDLEESKTYLLITSGFLDDDQNDDAPFEVLIFPTDDEEKVIIDGHSLDRAARVRFTHASIDPAIASADLFLEGHRILSGLGAHETSHWLPVRSGEEMTLELRAHDESQELGSHPITFAPGNRYFAIINGVSDPDAYPENPDRVSPELKLSAYSKPRQQASHDDRVDILSFHGAIDLPDIRVMGVLSDDSEIQLVEKFRHTSFASYQSLPPEPDITIEVRNPDNGSIFLAETLSFEDFEGQALLMIVIGLDDPDAADDPDAPGLSFLFIDQDGEVINTAD